MIIFDLYGEILDKIKTGPISPTLNKYCLLKELGSTSSFGYKSGFANHEKIYKSNKDIDLFFYHNASLYSVKRSKFKEEIFKKISICPYCGKSPFVARGSYSKDSQKKLYSFELDHFLDKSKYPQFALSVYNLVPVCKACNQFIKRGSPYVSGHYFHPYIGWLKLEVGASGYVISMSLVDKRSFDEAYSFQPDFHVDGHKAWQVNHLFPRSYDCHVKHFLLDDLYKLSRDTYNDYSIFLNIKSVIDSSPNIYGDKDLFNGWYPKTEDRILNFANGKMKLDLVRSFKNSLSKRYGKNFNL